MRAFILISVCGLFGITAGCLPAQINPASAKTTSTVAGLAQFRRSGQQMVVEATLNRTVKAYFLVDTGADLTIIPLAAAKNLGITLHAKLPTVRLQTLADSVRIPLVVVDSLEVGGMEVNDVTVAVYDSPIFDPYLSGPPGLLGRDFLGNFRVQIDLNEGFMRLEKK